MANGRSILWRELVRLVAVTGLVVSGCAPSSRPATLARPTHGQSAEQQAADRAACETWAREEVAKTNPRRTGMYIILGTERTFERAYATCMGGRGYAVE